MTDIELKARAYDLIAIVEQAQAELESINRELHKRASDKAKEEQKAKEE